MSIISQSYPLLMILWPISIDLPLHIFFVEFIYIQWISEGQSVASCNWLNGTLRWWNISKEQITYLQEKPQCLWTIWHYLCDMEYSWIKHIFSMWTIISVFQEINEFFRNEKLRHLVVSCQMSSIISGVDTWVFISYVIWDHMPKVVINENA